MKIFKFLFVPSALKLAKQELETAQRELLVAETNTEFATSVCAASQAAANFNRQRIARLERRIKELAPASTEQ